MASENVEIINEAHETIESPTINAQGNVQPEDNNPHENNNTDEMVNDGMVRGFMQFMQQQNNSRTVTAK